MTGGGLGGNCTIPYSDPDHSYCGASARIDAIAVDPTNADIVYVGSEGGLSKSTDGGRHWTYLSDGFASQSVRSIAIDPVARNIIYVGTGMNERFGVGIYRSHWTPCTAGMPWLIYAVTVDPSNPNTAYFAGDRGVYKTTDYGQSYTASPYAATTGVPVMPMRLNLVQIRSFASTGSPTFRSQMTLPSKASSAYTLFDSVIAIIIAPAAWAILDVERLRMDVADNCAVKIQIAYQIGSGTRRESRVNVETVAGIMIVKLRNVHLCVRRKNCAQNSKAASSNDERANATWRFHRWQSDK